MEQERTYVKQYYFLSLSAQLDACAWIMAIFLNNNLNLQLSQHFGSNSTGLATRKCDIRN